MVRHIVFWKLKDNAEGNDKEVNARIMKEKLEALVGKIDGLIKAEVGFNFNPGGYDVCLYSELTSKQALEEYQIHPLHLEVKDFVQNVVTDRAVTDCEM